MSWVKKFLKINEQGCRGTSIRDLRVLSLNKFIIKSFLVRNLSCTCLEVVVLKLLRKSNAQ